MKAILTLEASFDLEETDLEYVITHVKETLEKIIEIGRVDFVELKVPATTLTAKDLL